MEFRIEGVSHRQNFISEITRIAHAGSFRLNYSRSSMICVGTSGFQYPEWKGTFYPRDISTAKMLPFYAEHFRTTETNYSFYRIPSLKTLANWNAATPAEFCFGFKAPREITHVRKLIECADVLRRFWEAIETLNEKLGLVLFQLPPTFRKNIPVLTNFLHQLPSPMKCAFEFRHKSWFDEETFAALKANGKALCIADTEKLSTPLVWTAGYGYLRLRKTAYSEEDIRCWAEVIMRERFSPE